MADCSGSTVWAKNCLRPHEYWDRGSNLFRDTNICLYTFGLRVGKNFWQADTRPKSPIDCTKDYKQILWIFSPPVNFTDLATAPAGEDNDHIFG
jgi:hypothetical protein